MSTRIASIPGLHLSVECACGRAEMLSVADLPPRCADMTVAQVKTLLRCLRCRQRAVRELRIIHVGGSLLALEGTRRD